MAIEDFQKIADLLLKSVAATAIAAGGLFISFNKNKLDQGSICLGMSEKLYAPVDSAIPLESRQRRIALLVDRYNEACTKLSDNETEFLMNSLLPTQVAVAEKAINDPRILGHGTDTDAFNSLDLNVQADLGKSGWVALGRVDGTYGQVNFDNANALLHRPLQTIEGQILKARWPVNIRENTTKTTQGANPIRGILESGDCLLSGPLEEVRGQIWTFGKVINCE